MAAGHERHREAQVARPRVGVICAEYLSGGVERWLLTLAKQNRSIRWSGVALADEAPSEERRVLETLQVCPVYGSRRLSSASRNAESIERFESADLAIQFLTRRSDVLVVWGDVDLHNAVSGFSGRIVLVSSDTEKSTREIIASHYPLATDMIAVSGAAKTAFPSHIRNRVQIIQNGVDVDKLAPTRSRSETRRAWNCHDNELLVGFVGRMTAENQPLRIAAAVAALAPSAVGIFCSIGMVSAELQKEIQKITSGRCRFVSDNNLGDVYIGIDCLVSHRDDGFLPIVPQAWAIGVPVVASPTAGIIEAEQHYGPLTISLPLKPDSKREAQAIREAVSAPHRPALEVARRIASDHFGAAEMSRRWTEVLVGEPPSH